jgi:hypothetical protein
MTAQLQKLGRPALLVLPQQPQALVLCRAPPCSRPHRQPLASCLRLLFPSLPLEPFHQSLALMVARHLSQLQDDLVEPQGKMYSIGTLSAVSARYTSCMGLTSIHVCKPLQPCIKLHLVLHFANLVSLVRIGY